MSTLAEYCRRRRSPVLELIQTHVHFRLTSHPRASALGAWSYLEYDEATQCIVFVRKQGTTRERSYLKLDDTLVLLPEKTGFTAQDGKIVYLRTT